MRRHSLAALLSGIALFSGWGSAAEPSADRYPSRQIKLIVPAEPGGGTDTFARALAAIVAPRLGQNVVIDNVSGGGGTLGVTHLVAARPDGYTLALAWNSPLTAAPHHFTVPYSLANFAPVLSIGYSSYVLCARSNAGMDTANSFAAAVKASNGKLSYGHAGSGGTLHLATERIFQHLGAELRSIPFGGAGETAKALLAGQIDVYGGSLPPILPHVASGRVTCPLLTSVGRNPAAPGAEGLDALGLSDVETVLWWVLLAPAGTPTPVLAAIEREFMSAAGSEQFDNLLRNQGATRRLLASASASKLLREEFAALSGIARKVSMQGQR